MIELNRKAEVGDRVRFKTLRNLMEVELEGTVSTEISSHGAKVLIDDAGVEAVRWRDMIPLAGEKDVLDFLIRQMKLIAAQPQGCGGNMTPAEIANSTVRIANETLAAIKTK